MPATPYLSFGAPRDYKGDSPLWTLRFEEPVGRRAPISRIIDKGIGTVADMSIRWSDDERVEIDMSGDLFDEYARWQKVVDRVERTIGSVHATHPLFAVVFAGADGMHEAPRCNVQLFARIRSTQGKNRARLVCEALGSDHRGLEDLALKYVAVVLGSDELRSFGSKSEEAKVRVREALAEAMHTMAFDYGEKPKPLNTVLLSLEADLVSSKLTEKVWMAAVRGAPTMGRTLADLAAARPAVYEAIAEHLQKRAGAGSAGRHHARFRRSRTRKRRARSPVSRGGTQQLPRSQVHALEEHDPRLARRPRGKAELDQLEHRSAELVYTIHQKPR